MVHGIRAGRDVTFNHGARDHKKHRLEPGNGEEMNWKTLEFDQLTAREFYLILRARSAVFVVEQSHVHLDPDGRDETSMHVFAAEDMSRSMPVLAYARI